MTLGNMPLGQEMEKGREGERGRKSVKQREINREGGGWVKQMREIWERMIE